jgi:hypothetical protein
MEGAPSSTKSDNYKRGIRDADAPLVLKQHVSDEN